MHWILNDKLKDFPEIRAGLGVLWIGLIQYLGLTAAFSK